MSDIAKRGRLIVIEGLDGSGKATQAHLLALRLKELQRNVREVSFPDYQSDSSALVRMYLAGDFGAKPSDVNAYAASAFYAVDRFASYSMYWKDFYREGSIVIADRYTTSNAIHQCSKLDASQWDEYLNWLFHFEYDLMGIPKPDAVIYLRVDPEISQTLIRERYHGDADKRDIHESDLDYLQNSRQAADYCAVKLGWKSVECVKDRKMRSIEDIQEEIRAVLRSVM